MKSWLFFVGILAIKADDANRHSLKMCGSPAESLIFYRAKIKYDIVNCPNKVIIIPLGD